MSNLIGMNMNPANVFVLGVGAQKAGTSWLHKYISDFRGSRMGGGKEWHVWDSIHLPDLERNNRSLQWKDVRNFILKPGFKLQKHRFIRNPQAYFDHFARILKTDEHLISGDITPVYCALDASVLKYIRENFWRRGIPIRVVFLMRDPIERCWSHYGMAIRKNSIEGEFGKIHNKVQQFPSFCGTKEAQIRTDYPGIIEKLGQCFEEEELFVGFYESLFTKSEIERLSAFLGIPANLEFANVRVNAAKVTADSLSPEIRAEAFHALEQVYDRILARYPDAKRLWEPSVAAGRAQR